MRLNDEQLLQLANLLKPHFTDETQQREALKCALDEVSLVNPGIYPQPDPARFAEQFVRQIQALTTSDGRSALLRYLEQHEAYQENFEPFIEVLRKPTVTLPYPASSVEVKLPHSGTKHRRRRPSAKRRARRFFRRFPWRSAIVIVLLLIVLPVAGMAVFAADAYARVQEAMGSFQRVVDGIGNSPVTSLSSGDFDLLQVSVTNLSNTLDRADEQTSLLRNFSSMNSDLDVMFKLLDSARQTARAAKNTLLGVQPAFTLLMQASKGNGKVSSSQVVSADNLVDLLRVGQDRFRVADTQLTAANQAINRIDVTKISTTWWSQYQTLLLNLGQLTRLNRVMLQAPDLINSAFGVEAPKDYLILSQNNDEIRPSGGYISTYGWMRVRRFRVVDFGYNPTTLLSPNPPPNEMADQIKIPTWWWQPARPTLAAWSDSWYADFPSTARMAAWYYDQGGNPRSPVSGVIAIDLTGFQMLLDGIGDLKIEGTDKIINSQNFRDVIYAIRAGEDPTEESHKAFLAEIYRQILTAWQTTSADRGVQILDAAFKALQSKHIMVYSPDPALSDMIDMLGWSGAQKPGNADYFMIADANLGNKSNSSIVREINYSVEISASGSLTSKATLNYSYPSELATKDPAVAPAHYGNQKDYFAIMQLYTPLGSQLIRADNLQAPVSTDNTDKVTLFVTGIRVNYDDSQRFEFDYKPSVQVESLGTFKRYRLSIQSQSGAKNDSILVQVKLPVGARSVSVSPKPSASYAFDVPLLEFKAPLDRDFTIEVLYRVE